MSDCPPVGATPEHDPDCLCGHPASEHGQVFGGRCYNQHAHEGNTFLCSCDELRVPVGATDSPDVPRQYVVMDRQILEQLRDCYGDEFALAASGPDFVGAVAAVRRLHWPSPDRDSTCDCYDGLQDCPTIAALNQAGIQ